MSRVLVWRSGEDGKLHVKTHTLRVDIREDTNDPTVVGKPRGPETPVCRYCGKDARHDVKLKPFVSRADGVTRSGWRCA